MKKFFSRLRLAISVLLLAGLVYLVDVRNLFGAFANIKLEYIAYLVLLSVVLIWISCLKWQLFVRASGHNADILTLMKYYTMSYFFNMFLPSSMGGDVARSVQLGLHLKSQKSAFAATFIERYTGFLAMNLLGVLFVALGAKTTAGIEAAVLLVATLCILGGLVCFSELLSGFCFRLGTGVFRAVGLSSFVPPLEKLYQKIMQSTAFARNDLPLFLKAMVLSFAFHFLAVVNTFICALAVGWLDVSFGSLCMVVPLVLLVSVASITPASIGIQEGAFLYLLMRVGATEAQGLGVALILRAKTIVTASVGGLLYLYASADTKQPAAKPQ